MEQIVLPVFFFLQLGDYLTTTEILKRGGRELNPVMKWIMDKIGVIPALFFTKVVTIMLIWELNVFWLTLALCLFYMAVVGNNFMVLRKLRGR